jgi:hypothetical protein
MGDSFLLFCLVTVMGFFGLIGFVIFRVLKGSGTPSTVNAVDGKVYLRPEHRQAFLNVLQQIQQAPERETALKDALQTVSTALWLPLAGSLAEVQAIATPATVPVPATSTPPLPDSGGQGASATPAPVMPTPSLRWFAPDNITLLLYVGAALMVIAAGAFVAGSWDAISGVARFLIVAIFAVAFLIVGELFIRLTQRLRSAGTTFRAVGTVLLPFVALAYDRFVLEGNAPAWYWAGAGTLLALLNYGFYRFTNPGRLTAYLGAFSLGILAVALPPALGATSDWTAASLWILAAVLFLIMARLAPQGRDLLNKLFRSTNHPIAESHLIIGGLLLLLGAGYAVGITDDWLSTLSIWILTGILVGLAFYFHTGLIAGVAALVGGLAVGSSINATLLSLAVPQFVESAIPFGLATYAFVLAAIAPLGNKRLPYINGFLTAVALFWAIVARSEVSDLLTPTWIHGVTIAAYIGLTLWLAFRFRNPIVWGILWLVANVAVIDVLSLIPSESNSILIPSLLYLAVAGLWLLLERLLPAPQSTYARVSFAVQALWMTLATYMYATLAPNTIEAMSLSGALVLTGLTIGWLWVVFRVRNEVSIVAAIIQGALALPLILLALNTPDLLMPITWLAAGIILIGTATIVPDFAKRVTERGGLLLTLVAPLGIVMAELLHFTTPSDTLQTLTAQGTLLGAAAVYGGYGLLKRQRWAIGSAGALLYVLYAWLLNERGVDEVQVYTVPLALLLFTYRWLFPTQMQLWEGLSALVLIGIGAAQALGEDNWLYSAILGAWGVLLLVVGITLSRRLLLVAGVVGILLAALRQLWSVVAELPPALIIGLAGLTFLLVAIVLLLTRDRWLKPDRG